MKLEDLKRTNIPGLSFKRPEIRRPINEKDCPAAPVCESVGNLRKSCVKGAIALGPPSSACIAGVLLLISRLTGMWPKEMEEEIEKKRQIGFIVRDPAAPPGDSD